MRQAVVLACTLVVIVANGQGVRGLRTVPEHLPEGPSKLFTDPAGSATTTVFLSATRNGRHPIGTLTSTAGTFINAGTTTEYMTQHLGTYVEDKYAKIESTVTREYYRVNPSASVGVEATPLIQATASEPFTGLVASSTSYEVHGRQTTEHTVFHYRTFIEGHYAHLVSSVSKVFSDPPPISATPIYSPNGQIRRGSKGSDKRLYNDFVLPRERINPSKTKEESIVTRTIGEKLFPVKSPQALKIERLLEKDQKKLGENEYIENAIRARSIDLEDGTVGGVKPSRAENTTKSLPTFTVSPGGRLNIPTPSIEAKEALNEVEPSVSPRHRFDPPEKVDRKSMDSVTYLGFVDFTTTIDDTVVIFRPKKTFSTATRNVLYPKIKPTASVNFPRPSAVPDDEASEIESSEPERHRTTPPNLSTALPGSSDSSKDNEELEIPSLTSGINPLKSLLAASSSRRNLFKSTAGAGNNNRPRITLRPNPSLGIRATRPANSRSRLVRPTALRPNSQRDEETQSVEPSPDDLYGSIDSNSDVELVYKTLYTTYTYFTTFFRASSTRIKSREEVISNIVTLTNILDPTDLESLRSSCEADATCQFASSGAQVTSPAFTTGFIGRPNSKVIDETPRTGGLGEDIEIDVDEVEKFSIDDNVDAILRTFYTTYTYFTTLFVDGTSSISTRTEVYSNVKSSGIPVSIYSTDSVSIRPTAAPQSQPLSSRNEAPNSRRLEYSSIARDVTLQRDITTPETTTQGESEEEETTTVPDSFIVFGETTAQETTTEVNEDEVTVVAVTDENQENSVEYTTTETVEKSDEVTERNEEAVEERAVADLDSSVDENVAPQPQMKTFYTTFTYFTTLFRNGTTFITSNLETVTNTAEATKGPSIVQPSVTFFTTFTYWTTSIDGDKTIVTSSEETRTDILPASVTEEYSSSVSPTERAPRFTKRPELATPIENNLLSETSVETATEIESSQIEPTAVLSSSSVTPQIESSESSDSFDDIDKDFTLGSSSATTEVSLTSSTSKQRTFTPVIRPNLFRRTKPNLRPRGRSTTTTVAIITRSDVTPTLIATPASVQATPSFGPNSSFLKSRSISPLSRARNRLSSSSGIASSSINPSSTRTSEISPSSTEDQNANAPSIIKNLRLRRPSPFRTRLRERQRQQLERLRNRSKENEEENENENVDEVEQEQEKEEEQEITTRPTSTRSRFSRPRPRVTLKKEPSENDIEAALSIQEKLKLQRERAQARFNSLFKRRRRPSVLLPRPNIPGEEKEEPLVAQESRRRKRQVGNFAEFGKRTRKRQTYLRRRKLSSSSSSRYNPSSSASNSNSYQDDSQYSTYGNSYDQSPNTNPYSGSYYDNFSHSSSESSDESVKSSRNVRRQISGRNSDRVQSSRSRSRFNPNRTRTRLRTRPTRPEPVTQAPTPSPRQNLRTRFRPRTLSRPQQEAPKVNRFNTNSNRFTTNSNRFNQNFRRPSTPTRSNLFDYDDYYDYDTDVEIQSSQNTVPDAITVTHHVPVQTVIPVRENGRDQFRDILTHSPSLEVIAATALKSTDVDGKPVIYANAETNAPTPGTKVITFEALRATETTTVIFTPTRIRGLRTSFSHIVPHTIYNIQPVTTEVAEPVDKNQLLSQLLLSLLGGQPLDPLKANKNPLANNPLLPQLGLSSAALPTAPAIAPTTPPTRFVTHTNTFVTTVTNTASTVLPITLRGREIKTTVVESSTEVVTATEYSTETIIAPSPAPAPAPAPAIAQSPLQTALPDAQRQILQAQLQQQLLNQQLLSQVNLDPEQPKQPAQIQATQAPAAPKEPPAPSTSVVTKFVSGKNPGEFSIVTSTVTVSAGQSEDDDHVGIRVRREEAEERQFRTRIYGDVQVVVKDPDYNEEWPRTLPARVVKDKFALQRDEALGLEPGQVVKTDFTTFTYFLTSLINDKTVTKTDIVVSSQVITEPADLIQPTPTIRPEATPTLSDEELKPSQFKVAATKTYFTTSTYFTTLIDGTKTLTKTRTRVKSSIVTETFSGGSFDYLTPAQTEAPESFSVSSIEPSLVPGDNQVKYLSLGPNIYGKIRTLLATYTYFTTIAGGNVQESMEVITQVSTSLFSTTKLPSSIKIDTATTDISTSSNVQLQSEVLVSLKDSFLSTDTPLSTKSSVPSEASSSTILASSNEASPSKSSTSSLLSSSSLGASSSSSVIETRPSSNPEVGFNKPHLSSLKESFTQSSIEPSASSGTENSLPTDSNTPGEGTSILRPPASSTSASVSPSRPLATSTDGSATSTAVPDLSIEDSNESTTQSSGVIDAVVGGIADGFGGVFGSQTPNVNIGPVLDAVATLLKGPIRNAIANRRGGNANRKSDNPEPQSSAKFPTFARLPAKEPNFIPVGGLGNQAERRKVNYEFIPLQQRSDEIPIGSQNNNGNVPYKDPTSRSDSGDSVLSGQGEPVVTVPKDVFERLKDSQGSDQPLILDDGRLVINDYIIKSNDPYIIDVLNRVEQSHLFGKHKGRPMVIRIVPGQPMNQPVNNGPKSPDGYVYMPQSSSQRKPSVQQTHQSYGNVGNLRHKPPSRPKKQAPPYNPQNRPNGPPQRPQLIRPYNEDANRQRPSDFDDSVKDFSENQEVVVQAPPNVIQSERAKKPKDEFIGKVPASGVQKIPPRSHFRQRPHETNLGPPSRPDRPQRPRGPQRPPRPNNRPDFSVPHQTRPNSILPNSVEKPHFQPGSHGISRPHLRRPGTLPPPNSNRQPTNPLQGPSRPGSNRPSSQQNAKQPDSQGFRSQEPQGRPRPYPNTLSRPNFPASSAPGQPPFSRITPRPRPRPGFGFLPHSSRPNSNHPQRPGLSQSPRPFEPNSFRPDSGQFQGQVAPNPSEPVNNQNKIHDPNASFGQEGHEKVHSSKGNTPQTGEGKNTTGPRPQITPTDSYRNNNKQRDPGTNQLGGDTSEQKQFEKDTNLDGGRLSAPTKATTTSFNDQLLDGSHGRPSAQVFSKPPRRPQPPRGLSRPRPTLSTPYDRNDGPISPPKRPNELTTQRSVRPPRPRPRPKPRPGSRPDQRPKPILTPRPRPRPNTRLQNQKPPRPLNGRPLLPEYTDIDNPSKGPPGVEGAITVDDNNRKRQTPRTSNLPSQLEQIEPSFTVSAGYQGASGIRRPTSTSNQIRGTVIGIAKPSGPALEYAGWYTEGDSIPPVNTPTSTESLIQITVTEKEAPKTVTYAGEWSAVNSNEATQVDFTPQRRPTINTNFEREWTVRDEILEPTRANINPSRSSDFSHTWGSFVIKTNEPGEGLEESRDKTDASSSLDADQSSIRPPLSRPSYQLPPRRPFDPPNYPVSQQPSRKPIQKESEDQEKNINKDYIIDYDEENEPDSGFESPKRDRPRPDYQSPPPRPSTVPRPESDGPRLRPRPRPSPRPRPRPELETIPVGIVERPQVPGLEETVDTFANDFTNEQNELEGSNGDIQEEFVQLEYDDIITKEINYDKNFNSESNQDTNNDGIIDGIIPSEIEGSTDVEYNRPLRERPIRPFSTGPGSQKSSLTTDQSVNRPPPANIEPDTGTFINIDSTSTTIFQSTSQLSTRIKPTKTSPSPFLPVRPTVPTPSIFRPDPNPDPEQKPTGIPSSAFTPRLTSDDRERLKTSSTTTSRSTPKLNVAGGPFQLPSYAEKPSYGNEFDNNKRIKPDKNENNGEEDEVKRKEVVGESINGAIVESIPSHSLSADDTDPETRCKRTCGKNEICQISNSREILCKCRPGFGRVAPRTDCEKSKSYQIEVLTTSNSEEITIVRLSPKAVHEAVEETFRNNIRDIYHGSEITSFKVGNNTKRATFYGGEKNLTRDQAMAINMVVHVSADDESASDGVKLKSLLEDPIKDTKLPLGSDIKVSRVSIEDFDECSDDNHNDCSDNAICKNTEGSYTCECKPGYHDLSSDDSLPGRVCSESSGSCDLCNGHGHCRFRGSELTCECVEWFAGRNCQINLKLLLIVGCVSVGLMIFIAAAVSCFFCRDKSKNAIPSPYGASSTISRIPPNFRAQGLMMDPSGMKQKKKSSMASTTSSTMGTLIPRPGLRRMRSQSPGGSGGGSGGGHGPWSEMRMTNTNPNGHPQPPPGALVIPRAKVSHNRAPSTVFGSDDDFMVPSEANRAMSERTSLSSRHRRPSRPRSLAASSDALQGARSTGKSRSRSGDSFGGSRGHRSGSVDPLIESFSDDSAGNPAGLSASRAPSMGRMGSQGSRTDFDAQSVARSYNETIIRPVTRPMRTAGSSSYRSSRSHGTSEDGRTMAERDGGSSFVVSPARQQLYRLHDSDGSLDSL